MLCVKTAAPHNPSPHPPLFYSFCHSSAMFPEPWVGMCVYTDVPFRAKWHLFSSFWSATLTAAHYREMFLWIRLSSTNLQYKSMYLESNLKTFPLGKMTVIGSPLPITSLTMGLWPRLQYQAWIPMEKTLCVIQMQLLVPITVVPPLHQWAHPAWQVGIVSCTIQYWVIPLMSFPLQWTVWPLPTPWKPVSREEFSGPPSLISLCPATEVYDIFFSNRN